MKERVEKIDRSRADGYCRCSGKQQDYLWVHRGGLNTTPYILYLGVILGYLMAGHV